MTVNNLADRLTSDCELAIYDRDGCPLEQLSAHDVSVTEYGERELSEFFGYCFKPVFKVILK